MAISPIAAGALWIIRHVWVASGGIELFSHMLPYNTPLEPLILVRKNGVGPQIGWLVFLQALKRVPSLKNLGWLLELFQFEATLPRRDETWQLALAGESEQLAVSMW